jgi:hypothetical protein
MNLHKRKMKLKKKILKAIGKPLLQERLTRQIKALKADYDDMKERQHLHSIGIR